MELLYVWVENCLPLEKAGLNFSNQYRFTEQVNEEKRTFDLKITTNKQYLEGFFGTQVSNVTAIVGKNGVGKSNLLDFLKRLLTNSLELGEKWVAAFSKEGQILIYYSFSNLLEDDKKSNKWVVNHTFDEKAEVEITQICHTSKSHDLLDEIDSLKDCQAVFYSNIFDFRDYGDFFSANTYIDISTNFLIYEDNHRDKGLASVFDQVSIHQNSEVERGFNFVIQRPYKNPSIFNEELSLSIPTQVKLYFCKLQKNNLDKINKIISYELMLRKFFFQGVEFKECSL